MAKSSLTEASTFYAQGGVAAVLDKTDSIQQHIDDTMVAGAHLCELDAVKQTVEGGRPSVDFLLKQGVEFTLDEDAQLHLTREGGHSQRRIIHAADATGRPFRPHWCSVHKRHPISQFLKISSPLM